jgi:hypothetical protein
MSALCIAMCTAISSMATASASLHGNSRMCIDTIYIQKSLLSKTHRISLTPDAEHKVVFFSVKGAQGRVYHFYVFDVDGRLVKQTEIRSGQTTLIKDIEKGNYFFEVFTDDMRIGHGQIAVR